MLSENLKDKKEKLGEIMVWCDENGKDESVPYYQDRIDEIDEILPEVQKLESLNAEMLEALKQIYENKTCLVLECEECEWYDLHCLIEKAEGAKNVK